MTEPLILRFADGRTRTLIPGTEPTVEYYAGLDLGQVADSTVLAVVEKQILAGTETVYAVRYLETWLGRSYVDLVEEVVRIMTRPPLDGARKLIVDATGVGRGVMDVFRRSVLGPRLTGVTITGGATAYASDGGWSVPKRDLISSAQVLLQAKRLLIAKRLPGAELLTNELRDFRYTINTAGHDSYSARSGKHDDILLATCLALWGAERGLGKFEIW